MFENIIYICLDRIKRLFVDESICFQVERCYINFRKEQSSMMSSFLQEQHTKMHKSIELNCVMSAKYVFLDRNKRIFNMDV